MFVPIILTVSLYSKYRINNTKEKKVK